MLLIAGLAGLFFLPTPWNVLAVSAAAVIEVAEVFLWIRFLRRYRVQTGAEGMVGERAEVIGGTDPSSIRVRVHGEIWAARASSPLEPGAKARVTGVKGLTLEVEPEPVRPDHGKGPR